MALWYMQVMVLQSAHWLWGHRLVADALGFEVDWTPTGALPAWTSFGLSGRGCQIEGSESRMSIWLGVG